MKKSGTEYVGFNSNLLKKSIIILLVMFMISGYIYFKATVNKPSDKFMETIDELYSQNSNIIVYDSVTKQDVTDDYKLIFVEKYKNKDYQGIYDSTADKYFFSEK